MPVQVIMPQLGESVVEGTITRWLKSRGEKVEEFEPLLEINTDKVDSEIPSPAAGVVLDILVPEGETIQAGTILAWIGAQGEALPEAGAPPTAEQPAAARTGEKEGTAQPSQPAPQAIPAVGRDRDLGFISPVVARIASEQNVDLYQVQGSGQGGRITKKDVLDFIERRKAAGSEPVAAPVVSAPPPTPAPKAVPVSPAAPPAQPARPADLVPPTAPPEMLPGEVMPLTPVRRAIAEHMVFSKHTSPHVTTVMEADLSRVVAHRQANKEAYSRDGANLTFTPYFISAVIAALKAYPMVNSSWSEQGILLHREINIGMATSMGEAGLIVPVVKNADGFSLLGLTRTVNDLSNRARSRQLKPEEVKGGTFTITNHGTSGSLFATPIINQPQCAILGVGAIQKRVVVINDAIAIRPMVYLTLTFDHRILDGAIADNFLGKVVEYLQNWG